MKKVISILTFLAVLSSSFNVMAGSDDNSDKSRWKQAEGHLMFDNFSEAMEIYKQLYKKDQHNHNTAYKIGYCYLGGESGQDIKSAIDFLKFATEKVDKKYKNSFKQNKAPIYAWYYLGVAYRLNKEYEKAIDAFNTYGGLLSKKEKKSVRGAFLEREIQSCRDAMEVFNFEMMKIEQIFVKDLEDPSVRCPILSWEANRLIFTNGKYNMFPPDVNWDKDYSEGPFDGVFTAIKAPDGTFHTPKSIGKDLQIPFPYIPVTATADGSELYLIVDRYDNGDIYVSKFVDGNYTKAEPVKKLNTKKWESHASITADGKRIYFTSARKGGYGGLDIWYSDREEETGKWLKPVNIGPEINTEFHEEMPYIMRNGNAIYFSSEGHTNVGGFDVFYSNFNEETQTWASPINLGYPFSTAGNDMGYIIENTPVFAFCPVNDNKRREGIGDCDCISLIDDKAPMLASISGIVQLDPENADILMQTRVKLIDKATGEEIANVAVDSNGKYIIEGIESGTYDIIAYTPENDLMSQQIRVPQNDNWDIENINIIISTTPLLVDNTDNTDNTDNVDLVSNNDQTTTVPTNAALIKNVVFANDSDLVDQAFNSDLKSLAEFLKSNPDAKIEVQGYSSQTGSTEYNMNLSKNRAESVKNLVVSYGANSSQIDVKYFGYNNPIASNDYPDSRMYNRRAEIKVVKSADKLSPINVYVPTYYRVNNELAYNNGAYFYTEKQSFTEMVVEHVFFDFDKFDIKSDYVKNLDFIASYMKSNPTAKIKLSGHTDHYGSDEYNDELSKNRVNSVAAYLKNKGVADSQLLIEYKGKKENITVATSDDIVRRLNRRVIVSIVTQGKPPVKVAPVEVPEEYRLK